jgi:hypothetical protein
MLNLQCKAFIILKRKDYGNINICIEDNQPIILHHRVDSQRGTWHQL